MLIEAVKLALQMIRRNGMRSFLTVLGVVIGVAAVISMVTIGNGATAKVTADLAKLGRNLLFARPGQFGPGRASTDARPFNIRDVEALRGEVSGLRAVAPVSQKPFTVVFGSENRLTQILGTENDYLLTQEWHLAAGRQFAEGEARGGRAVCILGLTVVQRLFGAAEPLGQIIRVKNVACEVIGVLGVKGQSSTGIDQDDVILMPLRVFQRRLAGNTDVGTIMISANDGVDTGRVQADVERLLRERRNVSAGQEDDFSVRDMRQLAQTQTATTGILTALLSAVAAVSLLVGGIGIMNIMLVSVTERTREIGIRLAIGALERQVLTQFLVEAVVLSLFGGIAGIALGLALAWLATAALQAPFILDPTIIAIAFGFSALVGVVFGYFPARRAARLGSL